VTTTANAPEPEKGVETHPFLATVKKLIAANA